MRKRTASVPVTVFAPKMKQHFWKSKYSNSNAKSRESNSHRSLKSANSDLVEDFTDFGKNILNNAESR